jgi:hypothetical protein
VHDRYHHDVKHATYAVRDNHAFWEGRSLRAWTDVLVDTLVAEFDPVSIILFGSLATESDGPDSDIDLLVVLDDAPMADRRRTMVEMRRARGASPHHMICSSRVSPTSSATQRGRARPSTNQPSMV